MNLNIVDAATPIQPQTRTTLTFVTLWEVRGIPNLAYPTKIAAEVAARACFPNEDADVRYRRIYFRDWCWEAP